MRRNNIAKSITNVVRALTTSGLHSILTETLETLRGRGEKSDFNASLLDALNKYSIEFKQFGDLEIKITEILRIKELADPNHWENLVTIKAPSFLLETQQKVDFAVTYLPQFFQIIVPDYIRFDISKEEPEPIIEKDKGLLSCVLYDNPSESFTVDRFGSLFSSVSTLYEVSSKILKQTEVPLVLVGCDSGSEKSFDFLGAAKVIQMIKEIILSLWDRIVFYREKQLSQRLERITQALPIIETIEEMRESGKLGLEEAALLKQKILSSVGEFIKCGAVTPEMQAVSRFDPIMLMRPEPKQLTEGKGTKNEDTLGKRKKRAKKRRTLNKKRQADSLSN